MTWQVDLGLCPVDDMADCGAPLCVVISDGRDTWHWFDVDIERDVEDTDLAYYIAMVTAAHT